MANSAHVMYKVKGAKRLKGESFKKYKQRLKREKQMIKNYLKGELVWYPGGKRSTGLLLYMATQPKVDSNGNPTKHRIDLDTAKTIIKSAQGTLKGNPTGEYQENGLPVRKKPRLKCRRAI